IPQSRGITVDVRTDFATDLPPLAATEAEVREALTNLILNAIDALPHGGQITVRTHGQVWDFTDPKQTRAQIVLEVSDTGIGMDKETRERCLEPFYSTKGPRGTGLGLAMVYGVMERHDGKIEVASELGKGTTIRLIFPVRQVEPGESADRSAAPAVPRMKI